VVTILMGKRRMRTRDRKSSATDYVSLRSCEKISETGSERYFPCTEWTMRRKEGKILRATIITVVGVSRRVPRHVNALQTRIA